MTDIYSKKRRSEIMSLIRSKNTQFEDKCFLLMRNATMRLRKHPKGIFGKPDMANKRRRVAVFFDSDFWHGHDWKNRKKDFRSSKKFWIAKIERNIQRDKEVNRELKRMGWTVIRIWEHDLRNPEKCIQKILSSVK